MAGLLRWTPALVVLAASVPARANPLEVFGLTSRRAGQANTGVAAADDASALYYDPAGLVASPGGELVLGTVGAYSHLSINLDRASLSEPFAFQLAFRTPLRLGRAIADHVTVGLALHLLPGTLARVDAAAPDEALYPYYGDRLSRVVLLPGAAVRIGHGVSLGVALDVLASLTGSSNATETGDGIDARIDQRAPALARVLAGVQWQVTPAVRLGVVYRQRFDIPVVTRTMVLVGGELVDVDLRATGDFAPHQVAAGIAWSGGGLATALDVGYARWSDYPGPYVSAESSLAADEPGLPPQVPFEDTFSVRAGLESLADEGVVFRGGYGFESSPVPKGQHGVTNLLDGTKHTVAFGAGYVWRRLRVDAHVQVQIVTTRRLAKTVYDGSGPYDPYTSVRDEDPDLAGTQSSNPGYPSIKSGGEVFSGGLTLSVAL